MPGTRRVRASAWLALPSLLLLACPSPEERFATHVARGEENAAQGEPQKALLEYHSALKIRPDDPEINERVGDLLQAQRSRQDAAFFFREAYRLDATRTEAALKEARLVLQSDRRRAKRLIDEVIEREPDNAFAYRMRAELALAGRDLEAARAAALRATELAPDDQTVWMELGKVHQAGIRAAQVARKTAAQEDFQAAIEAFAKADEVAGGYVNARLETARVYAAWRGHRARAKASYRDAVELAMQQPDQRMRVVAASAAADYGAKVKDAEFEGWALRELVAESDGRLDAWRRLAALADPSEGGPEAVYQEMLAKRPGDPLAQVAYANFLIRQGRAQDAAAHLEESLEDGVQSPVVYEQLLMLRLRGSQLADARATFVRMADAFPDDPMTRRGEARLALSTGRPSQAAEILRELVSEEETFDSQLLLANAEYRLGNTERAAAAVDRAIELAPGLRRDALELKARIHFDAGQWAQVVSTYSELVARGQKLDARDRLRRGISLYEMGKPAQGRRALVRALEDPNAPPAAAIEYARREGASDPQGARAYLETAFQRSPGHRDLLAELTAWDLREGRGDAALARIDGVIESRRVRPGVVLVRANLLARRGEFDRAEADALRAFEAQPDSAEALDLLFEIYVAQGRVAEARRSFQEAEEAGVLHEGARVLLGRLALYEGDQATARAVFEKVVEANPGMAIAQSDLAYVLAQQGEDLQRALGLARQARRSLERNPGVAHRLGYVYLKTGRNEAALVELLRARSLAEARGDASFGTSIYYYHLGLALKALERGDEAAEAFETALSLDADFPAAADARRELDGIRSARSDPS